MLWTCQALHQHCHEHLWLPCLLLATLFAVHLCCTPPVPALQGTTPDISFMLHFSFYEPVYYRIDSSEPDFHFPSPSNEKKGYWVGFADNPGDRLTSLKILKRSSFVLAFEVLSELQQTSVLHHLQGRGPHFLFPSLILNNLQILCQLIPLMNQHPILSNLSKVSLVKMKIIQSTWPTLTFPIFLADPSFYHLRIMGSTTWPESLTLMTMDNLLKTLNSS